MKQVLFTLIALFSFSFISSQESLISDIMQVDAVNINDSEKYEEALADYQKAYDDQVARLDEALEKLGEDYKKEITGLIEGFTKTLEDAVEKEVKNEKQSVVTRSKTASMTLKSAKKKAIQDFINEMALEIRKLPKSFVEEKQKEIDTLVDEKRGAVESEYTANMQVIAGFNNTTHLTKSNTPTASTSEGSN
ncbi:MAG: hypothetical protein HKN09_11315 [Saprospiraceae bacterium]|nr:hypothetical protein [Saprospiraceae bacterium]